IAILVRVTFDSMPPNRRKVLEKLASTSSLVTTEELECTLGLGESATQEAMIDLMMLGICKQEIPKRLPATEQTSSPEQTSRLAEQIAAAMSSKLCYTLTEGFRALLDDIPARHGTASRICETGGE